MCSYMIPYVVEYHPAPYTNVFTKTLVVYREQTYRTVSDSG